MMLRFQKCQQVPHVPPGRIGIGLSLGRVARAGEGRRWGSDREGSSGTCGGGRGEEGSGGMGAGESKDAGGAPGAGGLSTGAGVVILERYGKENGCLTWLQAPCNCSRKTPAFPTDVPLSLMAFLRDDEYKPGIIYPLNNAASGLPTPTLWFCGPALSFPLAGLIAGWVMWGFGWAAMFCVFLLILSLVYLNWRWKNLARSGEERIAAKANELTRRWTERGVSIRFDIISTEALGFGGSTRLCHLTITVDPRVVAQNAANDVKMAVVGGMHRAQDLARGVFGAAGAAGASSSAPASHEPGQGPPYQGGGPNGVGAKGGAPRGPQMGPPPYARGGGAYGQPPPPQSYGAPSDPSSPTSPPPQSDYQRQVEYQRRQLMLQQQRQNNPYAQDRRDYI